MEPHAEKARALESRRRRRLRQPADAARGRGAHPPDARPTTPPSTTCSSAPAPALRPASSSSITRPPRRRAPPRARAAGRSAASPSSTRRCSWARRTRSSRTGLMLASGERARFDALAPELGKMTGKLVYLGEQPERAAALKLLGNLFLMCFTTGLAEMLALAKALDIPAGDAASLFDTFNPGLTIGARMQRMLAGDFSQPSWELSMARKDARLMLEEAARARGAAGRAPGDRARDGSLHRARPRRRRLGRAGQGRARLPGEVGRAVSARRRGSWRRWRRRGRPARRRGSERAPAAPTRRG